MNKVSPSTNAAFSLFSNELEIFIVHLLFPKNRLKHILKVFFAGRYVVVYIVQRVYTYTKTIG